MDCKQTVLLLDLEEGKKLRDIGIDKVCFHAENVNNGWNEKALQFIEKYPLNKFMTEDIRDYAYQKGLERPPSERAWGGVMRKAAKMGWIRCVGYQKVNNANAHRTPAAVWKRV